MFQIVYVFNQRRGSPVVRTLAYHAAGPNSMPGLRRPRARRRELLGVKTWLSTLEIVNLCVFRMRH